MKQSDIYSGLRKAYFGNKSEINRVIQLSNSDTSNTIQTDSCFAVYHATFDSDNRLGLFIEFGTSTKLNFTAGINYLSDLARSGEAKFIKFKTKRKGLLKLARKAGFDAIRHKDTFILIKEV